MSDLRDIWQQEGPPSDEDLLKYLRGKSNPEEQHALERQMADSSFVNDAVEGLEAFGDNTKLQQYAAQLNRDLKKQTSKKRQRKRSRGIRDQQWTIVAISVILLLCLLAFWVVRHYHSLR